MALNFNKYAMEGNAFLKEYAKAINVGEDYKKAGRILSSILFALRDIISIEESLQLIAQFPMFLKAVYVNGWNIKKNKAKVKTMEDFIALTKEFDIPSEINDFGYDNDIAEQYIQTTFLFLQKYVSIGELNDIKSQLPPKLKGLIFDRMII